MSDIFKFWIVMFIIVVVIIVFIKVAIKYSKNFTMTVIKGNVIKRLDNITVKEHHSGTNSKHTVTYKRYEVMYCVNGISYTDIIETQDDVIDGCVGISCMIDNRTGEHSIRQRTYNTIELKKMLGDSEPSSGQSKEPRQFTDTAVNNTTEHKPSKFLSIYIIVLFVVNVAIMIFYGQYNEAYGKCLIVNVLGIILLPIVFIIKNIVKSSAKKTSDYKKSIVVPAKILTKIDFENSYKYGSDAEKLIERSHVYEVEYIINSRVFKGIAERSDEVTSDTIDVRYVLDDRGEPRLISDSYANSLTNTIIGIVITCVIIVVCVLIDMF